VSGKAELDTLAIQDQLEAYGFLACIWGIEDVQTVRPDLSDVQCRAVLPECGRQLDAEARHQLGRHHCRGERPVSLKRGMIPSLFVRQRWSQTIRPN
jgi:hypothetical protein